MQVAYDDGFPVLLKRTVHAQARQHDIIVVARVPLRDRRVKEHRLPPGQTEHGRGRDGERTLWLSRRNLFLLHGRLLRRSKRKGMNVPVFAVLHQLQNSLAGKRSRRAAVQQRSISVRLDLAAGAAEIAGDVVAGGGIKCVRVFEIGVAGKRRLHIRQVGKADAREALQDAFDRRRRIPVDRQWEILHAVDAEFPFGVQLGKFLLRNILLAAFSEVSKEIVQIQIAYIVIGRGEEAVDREMTECFVSRKFIVGKDRVDFVDLFLRQRRRGFLRFLLCGFRFLRQRDFSRFLPRQLRKRASGRRHDQQHSQNDAQSARALLFR